jgi:hypothetical protein
MIVLHWREPNPPSFSVRLGAKLISMMNNHRMSHARFEWASNGIRKWTTKVTCTRRKNAPQEIQRRQEDKSTVITNIVRMIAVQSETNKNATRKMLPSQYTKFRGKSWSRRRISYCIDSNFVDS